MHMADALLSVPVSAAMWGVSVGSMAYSVKKMTKSDVSEKKLPLMAVSGAFVFAAQMINFAIPATGSSGHIGGGILLAGLLGKFPAFLTISAVLLIQCLFFADGGLLALGANIFNMGIIPCLIVYPLIFKPLLKKSMSTKMLSISAILSAIIGLQLGAFSVVVQTLLSGITELPFGTFVMFMQPIHLAIGTVEGIVTAMILIFVYKARPEIIESSYTGNKIEKNISIKKVAILLAALSIVAGGIFSLFASSQPDGLEWSVENSAGTAEIKSESSLHNNAEKFQDNVTILPDYDFAEGEGNGTSLSGIIGSIITCLLAFTVGGIIFIIKRKKSVVD